MEDVSWDMETIDWNQASKLGLIIRINKEVLHPLGLAMTRTEEDGTSPNILVASDGEFHYDPSEDDPPLSYEEVQGKLRELGKI